MKGMEKTSILRQSPKMSKNKRNEKYVPNESCLRGFIIIIKYLCIYVLFKQILLFHLRNK